MKTPLPPRFTEQVWKRIERWELADMSFKDTVRHWLEMVFGRPAFAVAYVSALFAMGLALGFRQANDKAVRLDRQLEARYVQSIDPYQTGQ